MSYYDYRVSREIAAQDFPFYALIMAAMRKDTSSAAADDCRPVAADATLRIMSYASVIKVARSLLLPACSRCGSTAALQAVLKPGVPKSHLRFDGKRWHSIDVADYTTVCRRCRERETERIRKRRRRFQCARSGAARPCAVCGQPMLAGQRGAHLSCSAAVAAVAAASHEARTPATGWVIDASS